MTTQPLPPEPNLASLLQLQALDILSSCLILIMFYQALKERDDGISS